MTEALKNKYISLQEATKYCSYSQEYLSLRARQGKLKSAKTGRNWVTTKEWLEDYLKDINGLVVEPLKTKKIQKKDKGLRKLPVPISYVEALAKGEIKKAKKEVLPPEDLPIGQFPESIQKLFNPLERKIPYPVYAFAFSIALIVLSATIFFNQKAIINIYNNFPSYTYTVVERGKTIITPLEKIGNKISNQPLVANIREVLKENFKWFKNKIFAFFEKFKISQKFSTIINRLFNKKESCYEKSEELLNLEPTKKGIVVVPSTDNDEATKEKIKLSFSDEVKVQPTDKSSGIIIPIFRKGEGEKYIYMMVPVKGKK